MKKRYFLLIMALILCVASCGGGGNNNTPGNGDPGGNTPGGGDPGGNTPGRGDGGGISGSYTGYETKPFGSDTVTIEVVMTFSGGTSGTCTITFGLAVEMPMGVIYGNYTVQGSALPITITQVAMYWEEPGIYPGAVMDFSILDANTIQDNSDGMILTK